MEEDYEGPGLTLREARNLLLDRHNTVVDENDPIMLAVTLHQAFLGDYERMLERHNEAFKAVVGDAVQGLTEDALREHLNELVRLLDRANTEFKAQYRRAWLLSIASTAAALISLPVLIYLLFK